MDIFLLATDTPVKNAFLEQFYARSRSYACLPDANFNDIPFSQGSLLIDTVPLFNLQNGSEVDAGQHIALWEQCAERGVKIVFLSDGRVFDGSVPAVFQEQDEPLAASDAASQLLSLEQHILGLDGEHLVLRTGSVFHGHSGNFLGSCVEALRTTVTENQQKLAVAESRRHCPTYLGDLVRVVSGIVDQLEHGAENAGVYHYNSAGAAANLEFMQVLFSTLVHEREHYGLPDFAEFDLEMVESLSGLSIRPSVPALKCEALLMDFGIRQIPWRSFLLPALNTYFNKVNREENKPLTMQEVKL